MKNNKKEYLLRFHKNTRILKLADNHPFTMFV